MATLQFTNEVIAIANYERINNISVSIRKRMSAIWALSQNYSRPQVCELAFICSRTLKNYIQTLRKEGIEGLMKLDYKSRVSTLFSHRISIKAALETRPVSSVKQAVVRIKELTGVELGVSQVRRFLHQIGLKPLKTGFIPAKADTGVQKSFLETKIEPCLQEAKAGKRHVFFMDAAHFVLGAYSAVLWCSKRLYIPAGAGRNRINVLGAINAIDQQVETVINTDYVNAFTIEEMLRKLYNKFKGKPITIFLDNARYQHCQYIIDIAAELGIELAFLPTYSPNLNLIERLWKFVKKNAIYNHYFESPKNFHQAVKDAFEKINIDDDWVEQLKSLLTLNFQLFDTKQVLIPN